MKNNIISFYGYDYKEDNNNDCDEKQDYTEIANPFTEESCLKNGTIKLISGEPGSKTAPPIYAKGDCTEISIFIHTKGVKLDRKDIIHA